MCPSSPMDERARPLNEVAPRRPRSSPSFGQLKSAKEAPVPAMSDRDKNLHASAKASTVRAGSVDAQNAHPWSRAANVSQRGLASLSYGAHRAPQHAPPASVTWEACSSLCRASPRTRLMLQMHILGVEQPTCGNEVSHHCHMELITPRITLLPLQ